MSIENRKLKPGTKLVATYRKQEYSCEVVKTKDGLRYWLADGREFKSPSGREQPSSARVAPATAGFSGP
jgi:hypothetical protein